MQRYTSIEQMVNVLKDQLSTDQDKIEKGISRIFEYQTYHEQRAQSTYNHNNVGFTPADAHLLSSFAIRLKCGKHLTPNQLYHAKIRVPKYARQLIHQSIEKGLIKKVGNEYIW